MSSDGSVIIKAEIDYSDVQKGAEMVNKATSKAAKTGSDHLSSLEKSWQKVEKSINDFSKAETKRANSLDRMIREQETLNNQISAYEKLLAGLKQKSDALADRKKIPGLFSQDDVEELRKLDVQIAKTEYSIEKLITQSDKMTVSIDKAETEMNQLASQSNNTSISLDSAAAKTDKLGNSSEKASRDVNILETALVAMVMNGLAKAIDAMMDAVASTLEFRKSLSYVEVNAKAAGKSMEDAEAIMAKFALTTDNTNEIMSATSAMLATGLETDEMLQMVDMLNGAMISLGEEAFNTNAVTKSYLKTLESGKAVGQFAYMLESLGVDMDALNKRLATANDSQTRQKIIMQELSKYGLEELSAEYAANNEELTDLYAAQHRYNTALAETGDNLQPLQTKLIEIKADLLEWFNTFTPETQRVILGILQVVGALLGAASAVTLAKKAFSGFLDVWNIGKKAKDTASDVTNMGKSLETAGESAGKSKTGFLEAALGIMLIAVSVAAIILALAVLVSAFDGFDGNALAAAGAIAIIIVAATGMVAVLALIAKSVKENSSSMIQFAVVIGIIAVAISAMVLAIVPLINALNESDESAMDIAKAIALIVIVMAGAIAIIAVLGTTLGQASAPLMMFGVALLVVAAAISLIALSIAALIYSIKGIPPIQINYDIGSVPTVGQLKGQVSSGLAVGTESASKGWHIVGEKGPELRYFNGGERVLTASQTMAQSANFNSGKNQTIVYQIENISIPADTVSAFVDVLNVVNNEATSIQQGYVGGY